MRVRDSRPTPAPEQAPPSDPTPAAVLPPAPAERPVPAPAAPPEGRTTGETRTRAFTARLDAETEARFDRVARALSDRGAVVRRPVRKGSAELRAFPPSRADVLRALLALVDDDEELLQRTADPLRVRDVPT